MWKSMVVVVDDFGSSLQQDVGLRFLHLSNVLLYYIPANIPSCFVRSVNGMGWRCECKM